MTINKLISYTYALQHQCYTQYFSYSQKHLKLTQNIHNYRVS